MTNYDLFKYMAVGIAWWLWENWWKVGLVIGIVVVIVIVWIGR